MKSGYNSNNESCLRVVALHTIDESFDVQELLDEHGQLFDRESSSIRREAWAFGSVPLIVIASALGAEASLVDSSSEATFGDPVGSAMVILASRMGLMPEIWAPQFPVLAGVIHDRPGRIARTRYSLDASESVIFSDICSRTGFPVKGELLVATGFPSSLLQECNMVYRMGSLCRLDEEQKKHQKDLAESLVSSGQQIVGLSGAVFTGEAKSPGYGSGPNVWFGMVSITNIQRPALFHADEGFVASITRTIRAITRTDIPRITGWKKK